MKPALSVGNAGVAARGSHGLQAVINKLATVPGEASGVELISGPRLAVRGVQRCAHTRGEHQAGVLPQRSCGQPASACRLRCSRNAVTAFSGAVKITFGL